MILCKKADVDHFKTDLCHQTVQHQGQQLHMRPCSVSGGFNWFLRQEVRSLATETLHGGQARCGWSLMWV